MTDIESLLRPNFMDVSTALAKQDAICLYALARHCHAPEVPAAEYVGRIQLHSVGSITAVIGIVPIDEYCGVDAERNLANVAWLAPRVRRHAELVNWTRRWSPVFPAPFGTFYKSVESLTEFLRAHEETIAAFLERVAEKDEWELRAPRSSTARTTWINSLTMPGPTGARCQRASGTCAFVGIGRRCWTLAAPKPRRSFATMLRSFGP